MSLPRRRPIDPQRIVGDGYDQIAECYAEWISVIEDHARERHTALLVERLPTGASVLELGCGAGIPTTRRLAERFAVTGVDLSARQIELARRDVPNATFVQADMTAVEFPEAAFDAVVSFYAITHVPRVRHAGLFGAVVRWLKPGGLFVATLGAGSSPDVVEDDWLGVPMYFSHFGARTNARLVGAAGLIIDSARVEKIDEGGNLVPFLWVVAEKRRS